MRLADRENVTWSENRARRFGCLWLAIAWLACFGLASPSFAVDSDSDGIDDLLDNCTATSNAGQRDSDADGLGNRCDADVDQSQFINSVDFSIVKRDIATGDLNSDLDDDGAVGASDLAAVAASLLLAPGPSAVEFDSSFVANPPVALSVEVFTIDGAGGGPGPHPGIVVATFDPGEIASHGIGGVIALHTGESTIALNDLGIAPDVFSSDDQFTGNVGVDTTGIASDITDFTTALASIPSPTSTTFDGRATTGTSAFSFTTTSGTPPLPGLTAVAIAGPPPPPPVCGEEEMLVITHEDVIADPLRTFDLCDSDGDTLLGNPNGPWSFKSLMVAMAQEQNIDPRVFVHDWLSRWLPPSEMVNGETIPHRGFGMETEILDQMPSWEDVEMMNDPTELDLDELPFRLLAIVNRLDLGGSSIYGPGSPAETRFVFGLLENADNPVTCQPHPLGMSVIFEYKDTPRTCSERKERAKDWLALCDHTLGSVAYNDALQGITDDVTVKGRLNQLRTNDVAMGAQWQMREFVIETDVGSPEKGQLVPDTLKQSPSDSHNGTTLLRDWVNDNENALLRESHTVPLEYSSTPFRASHTNYLPSTHFDIPDAHNANARRNMSFNTCAGCHAAEALDPGLGESFYHVDPRTPMGQEAKLSRFMTGTETTAPFSAIEDPGEDLPDRHFDDLTRRGEIVQSLALNHCGFVAHLPFLLSQGALSSVH